MVDYNPKWLGSEWCSSDTGNIADCTFDYPHFPYAE